MKLNRQQWLLLTAVLLLCVVGAIQWGARNRGLEKDLVSMNDQIRNDAFQKMQRLPYDKKIKLIEPLSVSAEDPDWHIRRFALYSLRKLEITGDQMVPVFITALDDAQTEVRQEAVISLNEVGTSALPLLIASMEKETEPSFSGATQVLKNMGAAAGPTMIKALAAKSPKLRATLARLLGEIDPPWKEAETPLIDLLKDKEPAVRYAAAAALNRINPEAEQTVPIHLAAFKNTPWPESEPYLKALAQLGTKAKDAIPALKDLMKTAHDGFLPDRNYLRPALATALGAIDPRRPAAVDLLWDLKQKDALLRYRATLALGHLTPPNIGTISDLSKSLRDPDPYVAARSVYALNRFEAPALDRAATAIVTGTFDALKNVKDSQVEGFSSLANDLLTKRAGNAVAWVMDSLQKKTISRDKALALLSGLKPEAGPTVLTYVNSKNATVKEVAALTLTKIQPSVEPPQKPDADDSALKEIETHDAP